MTEEATKQFEQDARDVCAFVLSHRDFEAFKRSLEPSNVVSLDLVRLMRRLAPWG